MCSALCLAVPFPSGGWPQGRGGVSSSASPVPNGPGSPGLRPLPPLSPWLRCALPLWLPGWPPLRGLRSPWLPLLPLRFWPRLLRLSSRRPGRLLLWLPSLPSRRLPLLPWLRPPLPVSLRGLRPWLRRSLPVWLPSLPLPLLRPVWLPLPPVSGFRLRLSLLRCALRSWVSSPFRPGCFPVSIIHLCGCLCQGSGPCFSWVCGFSPSLFSP